MFSKPLPFTLRQMQYALAVNETRNFRRAAELCAVAQPSLSSQIAALEASFGVPLFERGAGGVRVTPPGELLLARMAHLLTESQELLRASGGFRDPLAGPLRLGIIPTLAPYTLPFLVPTLREALPRLMPLWTEARTDVLVAALQRGELQGAILALEAELGDLEHHVLGEDPFQVCLPAEHRLARDKRPLRMEELEGEHLLLLEDGHCLRGQALAACGQARIEELGYRATSLSTLVQMVGSGAGLTLLPRLAVATETSRATVTVRPLARPTPFRTLVLAWRRGSFARDALRRLGTLAARALREHPNGM